ncbi:gypsy type transposase [Tanacetum coccineum]|uniref:Gypsy type transposase n=1 Tax=Tanacetum coccineum TaxID=301880 RepID=A0ABQ5IDZ6_9ASTR
MHEKTMTPRSCLRWKPTGKLFKTVGLKWIPTGNILTSSTTKVDSEPTNGSNDDITNQYECKQTLDVSAGLRHPRQITSDHNSLELGIHDHSNELSSSKLVPKVVPPADKTATSRQELELLFHHHITMLRKANVSCYSCNEKGHYARDCQKPRVRDAKYFSEQMLLAMKDEAGIILMARIQRKAEIVPSYDAKAVMRVLGYKNPERLKKANTAQPKIYDGEMLHSAIFKTDSSNSEETLEDAEESRLKMRNKMNLKELKEVLIEEVQEMLNIFESMEQKVNGRSPKENILQNEIDKFLELCVDFSSNSIRRPKSKDTKSKDRVLKNNNDKRPSAHVQKMSSSVSIDSNKRETMHSDLVMHCLNSSVKRALFTTPIAVKSKNLGATSLVAKSILSVAKNPTVTNKVSSVLPLSPDSSQSRWFDLIR